ncbi:hypothetical protein [Sinorhizobium meliloti]
MPIEREKDLHVLYRLVWFGTTAELAKVKVILKDLKLTDSPDVVLIDARRDNKPSASKAA